MSCRKLPCLLLVAVAAVFWCRQSFAGLMMAGKYVIAVKEFATCEGDEEGNDVVELEMAKEEQVTEYKGTFNFVEGMDDGMDIVASFEKWSNGAGWQGNAYNYSTNKVCSDLAANFPNIEAYIFQTGGIGSCPIPKGKKEFAFPLVDNMTLKNIENLPYGKYRATVLFMPDGKRVGCFTFTAEVIEAN